MPTNRTTPVVFVTTNSDFECRARSSVSGGNDFITKPFLLVELAAKALTWVFNEDVQSQAPSVPTAAVSATYGGHKAPLASTGAQPSVAQV